MYVTMTEMIVIIDTLRGSDGISDNGHIFGYTKGTRSGLNDALLKRLSDVRIGVQDGEAANIPDNRIERLALTLANAHIGDGDCLGKMGRELEKRLMLKHPGLEPCEEDDDE